MTISNMIGPVEQMALANQPICGFYYMVVGPPQVLNYAVTFYFSKYNYAVTLVLIIYLWKTNIFNTLDMSIHHQIKLE